MNAMTLLFYLFLQISSLHRGFALDNCTDLQRHKRLARDVDYIGCYDLGCLNLEHNVSFSEHIGATPESCAARCGDKGFVLAYVYQGSGCSCSSDGECLENPVEIFRCGLPCRQDFNKFCGGLDSSAVYKVRSPNISRSNTTDETKQTSEGTGRPPARDVNTIYMTTGIGSAVIIYLIIIFACLRRRARASSHVNEERPHSAPQDKLIQDRDDRVATVTQYQPLNGMPRLPNIPQEDAAATTSSGTEVKDVIYEETDLGESSVHTAGTALAHEYLVLGQEVPLRNKSSDEYHEYNYPEIIQRKTKNPVRESRVGDDGYLIAEPDFQGLSNPRSKVYYSSRLPILQSKGEAETSPPPTSKVYYSSRIPISVHQGGNGSSRRSDTKPFSAHISGPVHRDDLGHSTDPAALNVYYSTRLRRSVNQGSEISFEKDNREDDGYIQIEGN